MKKVLTGIELIGSTIGVPWPASLDTELCKNMDAKTQKEKLICAGAMIAAEIDRIQAIEK